MRLATALTMPQAADSWSAISWSMVAGSAVGWTTCQSDRSRPDTLSSAGAHVSPAMAVAVHSARPSRIQSSTKSSVVNQACASWCSASVFPADSSSWTMPGVSWALA